MLPVKRLGQHSEPTGVEKLLSGMGLLVTALDIEALTELGLTSTARDWRSFATPALFSVICVFGLGLFIYRLAT